MMVARDSGFVSILSRPRCWIFDCDGVLLDSNGVKTDAFYRAALPYGEKAAQELVRYHRVHGGISRFHKFEHLFSEILKQSGFEQELEKALNIFAEKSRQGVLKAAEAPGLRNLLETLRRDGCRLFVVSGGMQSELRDVFKKRGLDGYFDNIFGSPDTKEEIIERELANGTIEPGAVFIGDSQYDYDAAHRFGFDFIFVSDWSEFSGWQEFFVDKDVSTVPNLGQLTQKL